MTAQLILHSNQETRKEVLMLFLILLKSLLVEAGPSFDRCLTEEITNGSRLYSDLLDYSFAGNTELNNGKAMHLCCNRAVSAGTCVATTEAECENTSMQCSRISQTIFCSDYDFDDCGGIVGDTLITSSKKIGSCSLDFSDMEIYLRNNDFLRVNTVGGETSRYATWSCPTKFPCRNLACGWDNGGWTCYNRSSVLNVFDINVYLDTSLGCYLQWPAPFPVVMAISPSPITVTNTMTISSSSSVSPMSAASTIAWVDNSSLIVGLASATGVLGLYSLVTIGIAGFWLWKRFSPSLG